MIFTIDHRDESGSSESDFNNVFNSLQSQKQSTQGLSTTYKFEDSTWFSSLGARLDQTEVLKNIFSYNTLWGWKSLESNTKIYIAHGTGYKRPSLYQLYSTYGNSNLTNETSVSTELSLEQKVNEYGQVRATAFQNNYQNSVDFDLISQRYFNNINSQIQGIEFESKHQLNENFGVSAVLSYLQAVDKTTGLNLLRRPQNSFDLQIDYKKNYTDLFFRISAKSAREDINPESNLRTQLPAYGIVALGASKKIQSWLTFYGRIENAFDQHYQQASGYRTPARSFYTGIAGDF